MSLNADDLTAIWLTLKLATTTTVILVVLATPLALWLSRTQWKYKNLLSAIVSLPLVLPPTVLGFYLLLLLSPDGFLGQITQALGIGILPFTFGGLVVASIIYSLPFVLQPIQNALESLGKGPTEVAATLGAGPWDTFFSVLLPLAKPGYITAAVLGFAHTIGEFGVILMIGGNIPGETKVVSIQIYDHVEALNYSQAHSLSILLIVFSFLVLSCLYTFNSRAVLFGVNTFSRVK